MFDWGLARNTDPATSHEAAESIDATRLEMIVLEEFKKAPKGLTAEELSDRLPGIPLNTLTPRLAPLKNKGYLQPIGKRKARSGRNQTVLGWIDE